MAGQRGHGKKTQWQMVDLCRLQRPQQGLLEGLLSSTNHRPTNRRHLRTSCAQLHGCLLGLQPSPHGTRRPAKNFFHYPPSRQRLKVHAQLGRNMEVYIDDMIVKSIWADAHLDDLRECFNNIHQSGMKLNPIKCIENS